MHKRRSFFCDKDFTPTVVKLELPDKIIVDLVIKDKELEGLCWGGPWCMVVVNSGCHSKFLFWFDSKKTFSQLYQIASVSHSADDTKNLNDTG